MCVSQAPLWALAVFRKYSGTVFLRKSWNCCWHRCENINYDKDVLALLLLRALQNVVLLRTCINFHGVGFENTDSVQDVCQEFAAASIFCCWPTPPREIMFLLISQCILIHFMRIKLLKSMSSLRFVGMSFVKRDYLMTNLTTLNQNRTFYYATAFGSRRVEKLVLQWFSLP